VLLSKSGLISSCALMGSTASRFIFPPSTSGPLMTSSRLLKRPLGKRNIRPIILPCRLNWVSSVDWFAGSLHIATLLFLTTHPRASAGTDAFRPQCLLPDCTRPVFVEVLASGLRRLHKDCDKTQASLACALQANGD
jgi:hypothetical protein